MGKLMIPLNTMNVELKLTYRRQYRFEKFKSLLTQKKTFRSSCTSSFSFSAERPQQAGRRIRIHKGSSRTLLRNIVAHTG